MTKVIIWPRPTEQPANHGIGRVVHAQYAHLPRYGIQLVDAEHDADMVAIHAGRNPYNRVDVLHAHGLYWTGDKGSGQYTQWHSDANRGIIAMARQARAITVPSEWVSMPFKRDMRLSPHVIGHGIQPEEWTPGDNAGYVLWNKNRDGDVCNPKPAWELAMQRVKVVSTFAPEGLQVPGTMQVTGALSHESMRELVRNADIYLATVKETFGIGTLEAMACGVPVLGYRHGGTADIVRHEVDGYLAIPGDLDDLLKGLQWIRAHRGELSKNARAHALEYTWDRVCERYARLYESVASQASTEKTGVSVIVSAYNYGRYIAQALDSLLAQSYRVDEIIVVDDGSTDDTGRITARYKQQGVRYVRQENSGVAAARNHGVSLATQPFVICLDADDMLHPRYVEVCRAEMLRDRSLGIAYTGLEVFTDEGVRQRTGWPPEFSWESQSTPHVPPSNCVPSAAMFRRSMWERAGGYKQEYKPAEDTEFWTRGLSVGYNARRVTDSPWFIYRSHTDSASRTNKYRPIDDYLPWMRDGDWPLAAPAKEIARPRSYSTPRVSVIIPVGRGHEKYIAQALDSLVGQTMREWECIIVNDSVRPLGFELKSYPFVIEHPSKDSGRGAGGARNLGIDIARAPLVFFLDADDYLHPRALATLCKAYAEHGGRYVYGDWTEIIGDKQREVSSPNYNADAWVNFDEPDGKHIVSVLMATDDAKRIRFDESLPFWEDWDFFARCAIAGIRGKHINEPTVLVRRNTGTRTRTAFENSDSVLSVLRERYTGVHMTEQCCGGNGAAILAARLAWDGMAPDTGGLSLSITTRRGGSMNGAEDMVKNMQGAPESGITPVRLEFTGERQGEVTYYGLEGRQYRGANNPISRYINAHPADVTKLVSTGDWKQVSVPVISDVKDMLAEKREIREARAQAEEHNARRSQSDEHAHSRLDAPDETEVRVKEVEVAGERVKVRRTKAKREKESELLDLPEQD